MPPSTPIDETPIPTGKVEIADSAILSVIHEAVLSCYGVVDLASQSAQSTILRRLGRPDRSRGITIDQSDESLSIDLAIVVEFGTPIFTVAQNVMQTVKFQVEQVLDLTVDRVNVSVDDIRVSTTNEKTV